MSEMVHCQCYSCERVGNKSVETIDCIALVGNEIEKYCTWDVINLSEEEHKNILHKPWQNKSTFSKMTWATIFLRGSLGLVAFPWLHTRRMQPCSLHFHIKFHMMEWVQFVHCMQWVTHLVAFLLTTYLVTPMWYISRRSKQWLFIVLLCFLHRLFDYMCLRRKKAGEGE